MPWAQHSAITRRDEQLARTRRLTIWIASGATAASFGLAAGLGLALPGHTASSGAGSPTHVGSGSSHRQGAARQHRKLAPPHHAPKGSGGAPVVSSGGS